MTPTEITTKARAIARDYYNGHQARAMAAHAAVDLDTADRSRAFERAYIEELLRIIQERAA